MGAIVFEYQARPLSLCSTAVDREGHFYGEGTGGGGLEKEFVVPERTDISAC